MTKRIFLLTLTLLLFSMAQAQKVEGKKCKDCGKPLKECPYKGKHPNPQPTPTPTPASKEGSISITSNPSGAAVKLDGEYKGETPVTVKKQSQGRHTVTFSKEGYESATQTVTVTTGKKVDCHATLKKKQSQQQTTNTTTTTTTQKKVRMDGNDLVFSCDGTEYRYKMVYVSGGTYTMGCTSEQGGDCDTDERPAHSVTVSGFYMGQTEVTQALWKAVMGSEPTYNGGWTSEYGRGNNYPAYRVSYEDVKDFISKLNGLTGYTFRMPTEAEWEYAARGGSRRSGYKYSGGDAIDNVGWYNDNSGSKTHPVAQKRANELGLYDMSGNVWEWCNDWYGSYSSNSQTDPRGPSSGSSRVLRGGCWGSNARYCRVSNRGNYDPSYRDDYGGFRLAR